MNRNLIVSCVLIVSILSLRPQNLNAQINPENRPIEMLKDCFNDAITRNDVSKNGTDLLFKCRGDAARAFYETLGRYGYPTGSYSGEANVWNTRDMGHNHACWLKIEDRGKATQAFVCFLYFTVGDFINK